MQNNNGSRTAFVNGSRRVAAAIGRAEGLTTTQWHRRGGLGADLKSDRAGDTQTG
eukprot:EW705714.1.p2 GENE.EW705714.1~~EW705714.1.p2  ORF type:complete len:55 (-),score=2.57 EW705714.1:239-403(-)